MKIIFVYITNAVRTKHIFFKNQGKFVNALITSRSSQAKFSWILRGDVSVNCHNAPNYFYFSLSFFFFGDFSTLKIELNMICFPTIDQIFFMHYVHLLTNLIFRRSGGGALRKHENFDIIWMFMQCGLKMLKLCNEYLKCYKAFFI